MREATQKTLDLISALKEGFVLEKINYNDPDCKEFLFIDTGSLSVRGCGSAYGKASDRLDEILFFPEKWKISDFHFSQGSPYPWTTPQS